MNKGDIVCPRAKSEDSPCIVRDGRMALSDDLDCVMCRRVPRDIVVEFANRGVTGSAMDRAKTIRGSRPNSIKLLADTLGDLAITYLEAKEAP